ncbi:MAG: lamin tail domain-containing protein [Bacteroidales bacterium]|nr:lamin tail domain-containing protein [Bacteroidales bacterium]MBV6456736.1 hypothetical protein [Bacteroidales bacterium]NLZ08631.1 lamin tail domain-containing protein [Bacteroidales bacterium]HNR28666.1 hypothetical protein [Bacteroidales bacterium]HNT48701.1 hypothetical protein [Bacteroidales bacterium]
MKKILFAALLLVAGFTTSCVKDDLYDGPASISNLKFNPEAVTPKDAVTVTATITDLRSVSSAVLKYSIGGGSAQSVNMTASGDVYSGIIPAQADKAVVTFHVEAVNEKGYIAKSADKSYTVAAVVVDYSGLYLNELNGNDKFMELQNRGTKDIPLEGVYICKDSENDSPVWVCDDRTLAPGQFLLLYSEDVQSTHPEQPEALIFHSGLSAKKNVRIQLFNPAGSSIDDFNLTAIAKTAPASYSRNTDKKWAYAPATPGAANQESTDYVTGLQ